MVTDGRLRGGTRTIAMAVLLAAMASGRAALAEPTAEDKAGARATAIQANGAFAQRRYAESLDLFTRAESLMHAPTHVLMIARAQAALGQLVRARESYLALVHESLPPTASPAFRQAQVDGQADLAALEPRLPTVNVNVDDPNVKRLVVTMDGVAIASALVGVAHPVDPGQHVFKARGVDVASDEVQVKLVEGARAQMTLQLKPAPGELGAAEGTPEAGAAAGSSGNGLRLASYVGAGVGVVGIGLGVTFSLLGKLDRNKAEDAYQACGGALCPRNSAGAKTTDGFDHDANTKETIGAIALIGGGAVAATGVVLYLLTRRSAAPVEGSIRPFVGPGSAGVAGTF